MAKPALLFFSCSFQLYLVFIVLLTAVQFSSLHVLRRLFRRAVWNGLNGHKLARLLVLTVD